ncbi:hypothetical protein L210DRAFT_3553981 [Boletus edulis BED1]|uniref:Calcium-dependent phosphotriesterase n=1 Tax=Boletus edulis BED1 TaxID=1328754 RepID=A0AAD4BLF4_BOLED|nr:hypothetical protein L210DRAFT_3553981 [Boletus edulis BED1]
MFFKAATGLALALLAVVVHRSGRVVWHHILTTPNLPDAYYVGGNWTSHCSLIRDPASNDINFCEDITFWDHHDVHGALTDRLVLLGCDPNRKAWNTVMGPLRDPNPRGHLFLYVPTTHTVHPVALQGYPAQHDFHPLGMDIFPSHNGASSNLFIVNHARAQTTVEQFVLDPARPTEARYVRTLRLPYFVSPNAIALTSPTSFYVTNDHLLTRRLPNPIGHVLPVVETVVGLPLGWVAHVALHPSNSEDDDVVLTHTLAALGVPFANGIALSPSHTQLAVASTSLGLVYVYTVDASTPSLTLSHTIPVPFFPDNIVYDDDGALIVTGHPHFPALIHVAANKTGAMAPSWAVSLTPRSGRDARAAQGRRSYDQLAPLSASRFASAVATHEVETLFQSDGSVFGSSSTTLRDARTGAIYIAGLYEEGMLVCRP